MKAFFRHCLALLVGFNAGLMMTVSFWDHVVIDPFADGTPVGLWLACFFTTLLIAALLRAGAAAALGVYGGLIAAMLLLADAEYPGSSSIALTIHGLVPALLAAAVVKLARPYPKRRAAAGAASIEGS